MIRLLLRLFRIRDFEPCKSCETLKEQLLFERDEKKRLTDTLLNIINPKAVEIPTIELQPITQSAGLFSRRRAALEERDRQEAKILREAKHIGRPDAELQKKVELVNKQADAEVEAVNQSINQLENELGIVKEGA